MTGVKTMNDQFLTRIDHAVRKVGVLNRMVDAVAERLLPNVEAQACSGWTCKHEWGGTCFCSCGPACMLHEGYYQYTYYASTLEKCALHQYSCMVKSDCLSCAATGRRCGSAC